MSVLTTVDAEAVELFDEADWIWSDLDRAFVKARDPNKETTEEYRSHPPDCIAYEELEDHGLAGQATSAQRETGLQWLEDRLSAYS